MSLVGLLGIFSLSKGVLNFWTSVVLPVVPVPVLMTLVFTLLSLWVEFTLWVWLGPLSSDLYGTWFCWREGITYLNDSYKNVQLLLLVLFINCSQVTRLNAFKILVGEITLKVLSWCSRVDLVKCVGFSVPWLDRNLKNKGWSSIVNGLISSQLEKIQKTIRTIT